MSLERFYVYEHIRNDTGAVFYVGKGCGRRSVHDHNRGIYWDRIVNKAQGFSVRYPVQNVDEELSLLAEMELIDKYRKTGVRLVNVSDGGDGVTGYHHTDETKLKIGKANATTPKAKGEQHGMFGKKHTEESLAKMSASQTGRMVGENHPLYGKKHSDETRAKISQGVAGKLQGEKNGFFGKKHSDETKAKISKAGIGRKASEETKAKKRAISLANVHNLKTAKPVFCLTNGVTYYCINEAARQLNLQRGCIQKVCNGKLKKTGGYQFQWSIK
jgi:hypothetical protein